MSDQASDSLSSKIGAATPAAAGAAVTGADWVGAHVPALIQYGTLAIIAIQLGVYLFKGARLLVHWYRRQR